LDLAKRLIETIVAAVDVPVTLKTRLGWDDDTLNAPELARIAEGAGVKMITIHGRTRCQFYQGTANHRAIRTVTDAVQIPVIANGDIDSGERALAVFEQTGVDAVMIGRAAQGNPWIFRDIISYLKYGVEAIKPTADEIQTTLLRHLRGLYEIHGEYRGVRIARKHIAWYCKDKSGVASFRHCVNKVETATEQLALVNRFFACKQWHAGACNLQVNAA